MGPQDRAAPALWKLLWCWELLLFYSEILSSDGFESAGFCPDSLTFLWVPRMLSQLKQSELLVGCNLTSLGKGTENNLQSMTLVWVMDILTMSRHTCQGQRCVESARTLSSLHLLFPCFLPMDISPLNSASHIVPHLSTWMHWDVCASFFFPFIVTCYFLYIIHSQLWL